MPIRMVVERGPKGKKAVAYAVDWPGWSRGAKTPEVAVEALLAYHERYRSVLRAGKRARLREFDAAGDLELVEDRVGTGSTDFWGISFSPSAVELDDPMDAADLERKIELVQTCWSFFDGVAERVSPELRRGPRGGGRDRHTIVRHTIRTESEDFAKRVGIRIPEEAALSPEGLRTHRETYVERMRAYNAGDGKRMKNWTLPFLLRHTAFHVLDHAWEMEDKDLSGEPPAAPET
jgi:hypothetical protein